MMSRCIARIGCALAFLSCAVFVPGVAGAQTVARGPYLQQAAPTAISIRWRTDVPADATVWYGDAPGNLLTQGPVDAELEIEHKISLSSLSPNTRYYYAVATTDSFLVGDDADHYFYTPPLAGTDKATRIWVAGDVGQPGQDAINVRDAYFAYTGERETDVWLILGDSAYETGDDNEYQTAFFDVFPTILRNTPVWPTRGERDDPHGGSDNDYFDHFSMPLYGGSGGVASGTEAYYSFDHANVHFVCLDSRLSDRSPGSPMLTWLADDLAATTQDWIIAFWHHPPYSKGFHNSDNPVDSFGRMRDMRENVLPILEAGGVDLVLTSHSNSYERSMLLDEHYDVSSTLHDSMKVNSGDGSPSGDGPYYKPTSGLAPHEGTVYAVAGSASNIQAGSLNHPAMVSSILALGSMVIDVNGDTLDAVFIDDGGTVLDDFTIIKGVAPPPPPPPPPVTVARGPYLQQAAPTAISIRWRTDVPADATVWYGDAPGNLLMQGPVDAELEIEHKISLSSLSPNTRYYYAVATTDSFLVGNDANHYFYTSPVAGSRMATRIWVLGDSGQPGPDVMNVRDAYLSYTGSRGTNVWLMLGDNAYVTGGDAEYQAALFDMFPGVLRTTPLFPARGNHDEVHTGSDNDYFDHFSLPDSAEAGGVPSFDESYYSFDFANIHFICLDSEGSDRSVGSPMLTWLAADLASTLQDWIIAYWHHSPYSKGSHDSDNVGDSSGKMRDMRENALPILEAGGVDLVLTGHSHSYERSFLLNGHYDVSSTLTSSMKIDDGDGSLWGDGAYLKPTLGPGSNEGTVYTVMGSSSKLEEGPLNHPVMITSQLALGSLVIDVDADQLTSRFIDDNGAELDQYSIIKGMTATAVEDQVPSPAMWLDPASPNPFSRSTSIGYSIPAAGTVRLTIYDVKGRRVNELVKTSQLPGAHTSIWDGRDSRGRDVAPGVYFSVLNFGDERRAHKIVRVR